MAAEGEWAAKLNRLALGAWQKEIESAFTESCPPRFRVYDEEYEWVHGVLVPFLKREGLVAYFEKDTHGSEERVYLCVSLQ